MDENQGGGGTATVETNPAVREYAGSRPRLFGAGINNQGGRIWQPTNWIGPVVYARPDHAVNIRQCFLSVGNKPDLDQVVEKINEGLAQIQARHLKGDPAIAPLAMLMVSGATCGATVLADGTTTIHWGLDSDGALYAQCGSFSTRRPDGSPLS